MPEDGSLRPRPMRRLMFAIARAAALFILVTGIYGALSVALPSAPMLNRAIAALAAGVVIYEMLRPMKRAAAVPAPQAVVDDTAALDAQRTIDQLRDEYESRIAALAQARVADEEEARNREAQVRQQYERESEHAQRAASRALEEIQRSRAANDQLRAEVERERARAITLETQLADFDRRLASSLQELEALRAERQRSHHEVEETRQRAEVEKTELRKAIEAKWSAKVDDVQKELDLTRKSAQQLLQANEALTQQVDEERQRLNAELQRVIAESRSERDEMQAEARAVANRLDELLVQLDRERQLSRELAATRGRLDEEKAALQSSLEGAAAAREEALAQMRALQARIPELEKEWDAKLQKIVTGLTTDHENDLGEAITAREAARAEVRSLTAENAELKSKIETLGKEWDAKLQKIVTGLTTDHENDIGEAIAAREEARAEVRSLNLRISKLENQNTALKAKAEEPFPGVNERALREKIDAQWSEKLQTIVSHMASDHEGDVGKAIEEREAARAEVRNLNIKMNALQQKLDAERQARESLQASINAPPPPAPPAQTSFPIETPEPQEEQRARAEVLEFAEQAQEALRRITSPGDVPLPSMEKKARVLFVHHDPALRTLWRDNLDKSGFDVQIASDGLEGLRMAKARKPDVVIADTSMPKMDGRELCQLIKSNPETADVKVILMTGMYTNETPVDAAANQFEADELLRKPVKLEAMKTALANLLTARVAD